jgi:GNAT superfamily N-acetyltransferase
MTETATAARGTQGVTIRAYRPSDHNACRRLWAELIEHRRGLYGEEPRGPETGAGFEEYLTQLNLSGLWVADEAEYGVAGFIGLMLDGRAGEVDPVVVTARLRGRGIGRALLARVADEARRRGLSRLTVSPSARDVATLRTLHSAGFSTVTSVTLTHPVDHRTGTSTASGATLDLYDLRFDA